MAKKIIGQVKLQIQAGSLNHTSFFFLLSKVIVFFYFVKEPLENYIYSFSLYIKSITEVD